MPKKRMPNRTQLIAANDAHITRNFTESEIEYLREAVADIRAQTELQRLLHEEQFVRENSPPNFRDILYLVIGAVIAAMIGAAIYWIQM